MKRLLVSLLLLTGCTKTYFSPLQDNIDKRGVTVERILPSSIKGYDFLGLAKQDCSYIAKAIDSGTAIGVLQGTFGDIRPCLKTILDTGKIIAVRTHSIDGTVSNHACSGNVVSLGYLSQKLKIMRAFALNYPKIKWYDSPVLEHGCRDPRIVNGWFAQIKKDWPETTPVCSSNGQGYCPSGILKENHGGGAGDVTSGDGVSTFDANTLATTKDSINFLESGKVMSLAWHNCCNGRLTSEKPGTPVPPPTQRKNWCSRDEIDHLVRIMRTPPAKPIIAGCRDILSPNIGKPRSENYGIGHGDTRQNKPMLILDKNYGGFNITRLDGRTVGCFSPYGTYAGGGYRYYEGNCSGKNPVELMDLLGSEWGKITHGNQCYIYNPIRRLGVYR